MSELFRTENGDHIIGDDTLICKRELMEILDVSMVTVQRYMRKGMPYTRYANFVAYNPEEVLAWLKEQNYGSIEINKRFKKITRKKGN
jgi:phage terminase Nu1 subunit (DNA packaging protein)